MAAGTSYNYSQRGDMVVNRRGQNTVRHSPTNFRRFRLVKGIDTHLTFFVKDEQTEYGPMYLHDVNITAQLVTVDGQNIVLTKVLENEDTFNGQALMRVRAADIADIDKVLYQLVLTYQTRRGETHALYMDQNYRVEYTVEILENVLPTVPEVTEIIGGEGGDLMRQPGIVTLPDGLDSAGDPVNTDFYESVSSVYSGGAGDTPWGLHTVSIHGTEFNGRVYVQASLVATPTREEDFFLINLNPNTGDHYSNYKDRTLGDSTADGDGHAEIYDHIDAYIFEGNLLWVRFSVLTPVDSQGTVDKILYRH